MEIWQHFSRDARRAVLRAEQIARELHASVIAPEHLALGIIEIGEGSGWAMLQRLGVNLTRLREALLAAAPVGAAPGPAELELSSQAQRCLQTAYLEWQKHVAARTDAEAPGAAKPPLESVHLLLGLLAPSSRCECRTLISHGVFYGEVRELLRRDAARR